MVKQLVAHSKCHQAREQRASGHVPCARNARPISRTLSHVFVKLAHSGTHVPHIRGCEICFSILSVVFLKKWSNSAPILMAQLPRLCGHSVAAQV